MKVAFWVKDCLRVHPKVFSYFHGDYDEDEGHIYALGHSVFIREAEIWNSLSDKKLTKAEDYMYIFFPSDYQGSDSERGLTFMRYTTPSFNKIMYGSYLSATIEWARKKTEHLNMFRQMLLDIPGTKTFLHDSMKGVKEHYETRGEPGQVRRHGQDSENSSNVFLSRFERRRYGGVEEVHRDSEYRHPSQYRKSVHELHNGLLQSIPGGSSTRSQSRFV